MSEFCGPVKKHKEYVVLLPKHQIFSVYSFEKYGEKVAKEHAIDDWKALAHVGAQITVRTVFSVIELINPVV